MFSRWVRRLLPLELLFIRSMSFLGRIPLLWRLHRQVTARLTLLEEGGGAVPAFRIDFATPYLNLPVAADRRQIGFEDNDSRFQPEAFRFFDWQSWTHIGGEIEWHGERCVVVSGRQMTMIEGFTYRPEEPPAGVGNLGLRVVEGVEGTLRVLWGDAVVSMGFDPGYWMLEPGQDGYRVVAIRDTDLMVLIVSLSEIGSGNPETYAGAVEHLWQWLSFQCGQQEPESAMLVLLKYVRDWGPLGMAPLYGGLVEILNRLGVAGKERILFEFYADNWGVRENKNGRLLAVRTLEALETDASGSALGEILNYVRHRGLAPEELALVKEAVGRVEHATTGETFVAPRASAE